MSGMRKRPLSRAHTALPMLAPLLGLESFYHRRKKNVIKGSDIRVTIDGVELGAIESITYSAGGERA